MSTALAGHERRRLIERALTALHPDALHAVEVHATLTRISRDAAPDDFRALVADLEVCRVEVEERWLTRERYPFAGDRRAVAAR